MSLSLQSTGKNSNCNYLIKLYEKEKKVGMIGSDENGLGRLLEIWK